MKNNQIAAIDFANPTSGVRPIIIKDPSEEDSSTHIISVQGNNISTSEMSIQEFMSYSAVWFLVFAGITVILTLFRWYFWFKKSSKLRITVWIFWIFLVLFAGFLYWLYGYVMNLQMQAMWRF